MARPPSAPTQASATIGFEAKLWLTADNLRNNMDAAEYKHVVLGLIFLKYFSDNLRAMLRHAYGNPHPRHPARYAAAEAAKQGASSEYAGRLG